MPYLHPTALDRARRHVSQIATRLSTTHLDAKTITTLQAELATQFEANRKTGYLIVPSDQVIRLQTAAANLEAELRAAELLHLGDFNLPQLRYLLAEDVIG